MTKADQIRFMKAVESMGERTMASVIMEFTNDDRVRIVTAGTPSQMAMFSMHLRRHVDKIYNKLDQTPVEQITDQGLRSVPPGDL